jgi:hypothetical protein
LQCDFFHGIACRFALAKALDRFYALSSSLPMSNSTSESQEEPQSPRAKPPLARAARDSSELDLWDFDEIDDLPSPAPKSVEVTPVEPAAPTPVVLPPATPSKPKMVTPTPRKQFGRPEPSGKQTNEDEAPSRPYEPRKPMDDIGDIEDTTIRPPHKAPEPKHKPNSKKRESEPTATTDLPPSESWSLEEEEASPPVEDEASMTAPQIDEPAPSLDAIEEEASVDATDAIENHAEASPSTTPPLSDPEATVSPLHLSSLRKNFVLSTLEKALLLGLVLILGVTGVVLVKMAKDRLPTHNPDSIRPSFPVKGAHVTVKGITTFWREPIADRDNARTAKLIPAVKLELEGSGAIRVFFLNESGEIVGDPITRKAEGGTIEISSTGGFADPAEHSAYRTGEKEPWLLEVKEAPSVDSPGGDFKTLFRTAISNDRQ